MRGSDTAIVQHYLHNKYFQTMLSAELSDYVRYRVPDSSRPLGSLSLALSLTLMRLCCP